MQFTTRTVCTSVLIGRSDTVRYGWLTVQVVVTVDSPISVFLHAHVTCRGGGAATFFLQFGLLVTSSIHRHRHLRVRTGQLGKSDC